MNHRMPCTTESTEMPSQSVPLFRLQLDCCAHCTVFLAVAEDNVHVTIVGHESADKEATIFGRDLHSVVNELSHLITPSWGLHGTKRRLDSLTGANH